MEIKKLLNEIKLIEAEHFPEAAFRIRLILLYTDASA